MTTLNTSCHVASGGAREGLVHAVICRCCLQAVTALANLVSSLSLFWSCSGRISALIDVENGRNPRKTTSQHISSSGNIVE